MLDPIAPHALAPSELKRLLAAEREGEPFFAFKDADERLALFRAGRGGPVLSAHHITPRDDGGADHPANLETLCAGCHGRETAHQQHERRR